MLFGAAFSLNDAGQPLCDQLITKLDPVQGFTSESIGNAAKAQRSKAIATGNDLGCFAAVTKA